MRYIHSSARRALSIFMSMLALVGLLFVAGCGSTSSMDGPPSMATAAPKPKLTKYTKVYVQDIQTSKAQSDVSPMEMTRVGKDFSDMISDRITASNAFTSVERIGPNTDLAALAESVEEEAIIIRGNISRFKNGSPLARAVIGFGLGSSYLDADVDVVDAKTGAKLGKIVVDKNSWPLGGMVAATQTGKSYLPGAARKIATELRHAKTAI